MADMFLGDKTINFEQICNIQTDNTMAFDTSCNKRSDKTRAFYKTCTIRSKRCNTRKDKRCLIKIMDVESRKFNRRRLVNKISIRPCAAQSESDGFLRWTDARMLRWNNAKQHVYYEDLKEQYKDRICHTMKLKDFVYSTLPRKNKKPKRKCVSDHVTLFQDLATSFHEENHVNDTFPIQYNKCLVTEDFQYKDADFDNDYISLADFNENASNIISGKSVVNCPTDFGDVNFNTLPRCRTRIKTNPWLPSPKTSPSPSGFTSPMTSSMESTGVPEFAQEVGYIRDGSLDGVVSPVSSCTESGFSSSNVTTESCDDTSAFNDSPLIEGKRHYYSPSSLRYQSINSSSSQRHQSIGSSSPRRQSMDSANTEYDSIMQTSFVSDVFDYTPEEDCYNNCVKDTYHHTYETDFEQQVESSCEELFTSRDDIFDVFSSREDLYQMETFGVYDEKNNVISSQNLNHSKSVPTQTCMGNFSEPVDIMQQSLTNSYCSMPESAVDSTGTTEYLVDSEGINYPQMAINSETTQVQSLSNHEYKLMNINKERLPVSEHNYCDENPTSKCENRVIDNGVKICYERIQWEDDQNNVCDNSSPEDMDITHSAGKQSHSCVDKTSVINHVRHSLRDKVRKLKEDKEVVDEIVRKAREEQQLRRMELVRIQKQTTLARKEILVKTLSGLREKLEDQTNRLQSAYENIIRLQYSGVRRKHGALETLSK